MRDKYHIYFTAEERRVVINSLIDLRNDLILHVVRFGNFIAEVIAITQRMTMLDFALLAHCLFVSVLIFVAHEGVVDLLADFRGNAVDLCVVGPGFLVSPQCVVEYLDFHSLVLSAGAELRKDET